MRKRRTLKHSLAAICMCVAVLCTTLFIGDMEVHAESSTSVFQVKVEATSSVKAGKKATFKITITNTSKKSQKLTKLQTFFGNVESIGIGSGVSGCTQFGQVKDSKGKTVARNKKTGKLTKTVKFAAKEKKVYTLSGTVSKKWGDSGLEVIGVSINGYNDYEYVGYRYSSPGSTKLSSVKAEKKTATVKWEAARGSGYQIQYSLYKNFKGATTKTVSDTKTSLTLKNLKSKKTYYVRIRAYSKGSLGSTFTPWSSAKKVTIK